MRGGLVLLLVAVGCSGASFVVKEPVAKSCAQAGLRGCDDMTDAVMMYVEGGEESVAREKLMRGASQNAPDQLKQFVAILRQLKDVPGSDEFMGPILSVAEFLDVQATAAKMHQGQPPPPGMVGAPGMPPPAPGYPPAEAVPTSPAMPAAPAAVAREPADTALSQLESGVALPGTSAMKVTCGAAFGPGAGYCVKVIDGPFVVTDLHAAAGCPNDLFATAGSSEANRWAILGAAAVPLVVHGARLPIRAGEALFIGAQAPTLAKLSTDARCAVTWSGFRPY